jgi:lipoate-protein ligase A
MALDEALAESVRAGKEPPTLRFYGWDRASLSIGCFQRAGELDLGYCKKEGIPLVRRPTGGRAVLHGEELTYSFSAGTREGPFSLGLLDSYGKLGAAFSRAFRSLGIPAEPEKARRAPGARSPLCFESASYGEITVGRKKIIGSAQKRWPDALLQQGSVPYVLDLPKLHKVFGSFGNAARPEMAGAREFLPGLDGGALRRAIREAFEAVFGIGFSVSAPTQGEESRAEKLLREKYLSPEWNYRR